MVKKHQWPQHSQLNVVFLDGSERLKNLVKRYSVLWVTNSNLSFIFYDSLSVAPKEKHIRISFTLSNASRLGNHGDHHQNHATMNLFDLISDNISELGSKRLILHEFGHALGLEHEYQNPYWPYDKALIKPIINNCIIKLNKSSYSAIQAKDKCEQINQPINKESALITAYDELSIMNYPFSFQLPNGANRDIKATTELSYLDNYAIRKWYPPKKINSPD